MFKKFRRSIQRKTLSDPIDIEQVREMVKEIVQDLNRIKEENKE